ncbi:MAG: hypothetical protein ABF295_07240 [Flavobacteriaceae bacterium]
MRYEYFDRKQGALFGMTDDIRKDEKNFSITEWTIMFLWNRNAVFSNQPPQEVKRPGRFVFLVL